MVGVAFPDAQPLSSRVCPDGTGSVLGTPFADVGRGDNIAPSALTVDNTVRNETCLEYGFDVSILTSKCTIKIKGEKFRTEHFV